MSLAVDDETGLVLRYAAEGTPYVTEVLDLVVDQELPQDRFAWAGELESPRRDGDEESDARDQFDEPV